MIGFLAAALRGRVLLCGSEAEKADREASACFGLAAGSLPWLRPEELERARHVVIAGALQPDIARTLESRLVRAIPGHLMTGGLKQTGPLGMRLVHWWLSPLGERVRRLDGLLTVLEEQGETDAVADVVEPFVTEWSHLLAEPQWEALCGTLRYRERPELRRAVRLREAQFGAFGLNWIRQKLSDLHPSAMAGKLEELLAPAKDRFVAVSQVTLALALLEDFVARGPTFEKMRGYAAEVLAQPRPLPQGRRLLFPSPGRSCGNTITDALELAKPYSLRVGHEVHGNQFYTLLRLYRQDGDSTLLRLIIRYVLEEYGAVGGNPSCFLLPFFAEVPGMDYTLLWVRREHQSLMQSIIERNFHYRPWDPVPERLTAVDYGEATGQEWASWSLERKVSWYVGAVERSIEDARKQFGDFRVCTPETLEPTLTTLTQEWGLTEVKIERHKAIPKHRKFSPDELVILFEVFKGRSLDDVSPEEIEALLVLERKNRSNADIL